MMTESTKLLDDTTLGYLYSCRPVGNTIPKLSVSMSRDEYARFNKVLSALGGQWKGGKIQAHQFPEGTDVEDLISSVLETGRLPDANPFDYYCTPDEAADLLIARLADVLNGRDEVRLLEPSVGDGQLVRAYDRAIALGEVPPISYLKTLDLNAKYSPVENADHEVADYLDTPYEGFDVILLNPPYRAVNDKSVWIAHLLKAFSEVNAGGFVAAILPSSYLYRDQKRFVEMREQLESEAEFLSAEDMPAGSFKTSGTMVQTVTLIAQRTFGVGPSRPLARRRPAGARVTHRLRP